MDYPQVELPFGVIMAGTYLLGIKKMIFIENH